MSRTEITPSEPDPGLFRRREVLERDLRLISRPLV